MSKKKKSSGRRKPPEKSPEDLAHEAGAKYVQDQITSDYFHQWVWEQLHEAEEMRQRDPNSVIPLESKKDYDHLARNMLQQLGWDMDRDLGPHEIAALGVIDASSGDEMQAFHDGIHDELTSHAVQEWLADTLIIPMHEEIKAKRAEPPPPPPEQERLPGVHERRGKAKSEVGAYEVYSVEPGVGSQYMGIARIAKWAPPHEVESTLSKLGVYAPRGTDTLHWGNNGAEIRDANGHIIVELRLKAAASAGHRASEARRGQPHRRGRRQPPPDYSSHTAHAYNIEVVYPDEGFARKHESQIGHIIQQPLVSQGALRDGYRMEYGPINRDDYRRLEGAIYSKLGNAVRVRLVQVMYGGGAREDAGSIRWEPSGGGTGFRGTGPSGQTYLLRKAGGDKWNLHIGGAKHGPFAHLDWAKTEAERNERMGRHPDVAPQTWAEGQQVRDYIAVDNHDRKIAGPFKDYGEAKAAADKAGGYVRFESQAPPRMHEGLQDPRDQGYDPDSRAGVKKGFPKLRRVSPPRT